MTSRERILAALNHEEPDRVPVALGGGPYGVVDELYLGLLHYLGLGEPVAPFRKGHNITFLDDRLFDRLEIDTRYVWPGASPSSPIYETDDPEAFLDGFGQPWKRAVPYYYPGEGVLVNAKGVEDIEASVRWPDPADPRWIEGVGERARSLHEKGEHFVVARMVTSHGPFQLACGMRGTEHFMMDMAVNETFAHTLLKRIGDTITDLTVAYLRACGPFIDMIELPGDDYASNTGPMFSPGMFRDLIKPVIADMIRAIRTTAPGVRIMLHTDGLVTRLLPDFIDLGVDVIHPLEPLDRMDHAAVKAQFGDRLSFLGGIDITHAMPGSRADVVAEVQKRVETLGPGGGYVLAPSNHLQADVPPENVVALFEAARAFGAHGRAN